MIRMSYFILFLLSTHHSKARRQFLTHFCPSLIGFDFGKVVTGRQCYVLLQNNMISIVVCYIHKQLPGTYQQELNLILDGLQLVTKSLLIFVVVLADFGEVLLQVLDSLVLVFDNELKLLLKLKKHPIWRLLAPIFSSWLER